MLACISSDGTMNLGELIWSGCWSKFIRRCFIFERNLIVAFVALVVLILWYLEK
jgi:hypothetical protein